MAEQFYTILTKVGKAKIANAGALGTKLNLVKFQIGDSGGTYYNPTEDQTELKNKVWEGNISLITVDKDNPNWIVVEVIIPSSVGGFMIREAAILDDENNIIAVAKYPETYKPITSEGSSKDLLIRTILEVSNVSSVTLKVDPTVVLATKKDIEILQNNINNIKIPVTKVNGKVGEVELKAEDIKAVDGTTLENFKTDVESKFADCTKIAPYIVATGTANTYTVSTNPAPTSYIDGMGIAVKINAASTGTSTLNWNGLGAKYIVDSNGKYITNLKANVIYEFRYNFSSGNFILQGNTDADTVKGVQYFVEAAEPTTISGYSVKDKDVWIDTQNQLIKVRISNAWVSMGAVYQ